MCITSKNRWKLSQWAAASAATRPEKRVGGKKEAMSRKSGEFCLEVITLTKLPRAVTTSCTSPMFDGLGVLVISRFFFFLGVTTSEDERTDLFDKQAFVGDVKRPDVSKSRNSGASQLPSLSNTEECGMDSISTTRSGANEDEIET